MPPATQRAARLQHLVAWISSSADRVHMKPTAALTRASSELTQCRSLTGFPQRPAGCAPPRPPEPQRDNQERRQQGPPQSRGHHRFSLQRALLPIELLPEPRHSQRHQGRPAAFHRRRRAVSPRCAAHHRQWTPPRDPGGQAILLKKSDFIMRSTLVPPRRLFCQRGRANLLTRSPRVRRALDRLTLQYHQNIVPGCPLGPCILSSTGVYSWSCLVSAQCQINTNAVTARASSTPLQAANGDARTGEHG